MIRSAAVALALLTLAAGAGRRRADAAPAGGGAIGADPGTAAATNAITFKRLPGSRPQSAALLASGNDGGVLPLRLTAAWDAAASRSLTVTLEVAARDLFSGEEEDHLTVELTLYALGPSGAIATAASTAVTFDRARLAAALAKTGLRFVDRIAVPEGGRSLRALLLCRESGAFALRSLELPAPDAGAVASAAVPEAPEAWLELPLARPPTAAPGAPPAELRVLTASAAPPSPAPEAAAVAAASPPAAVDGSEREIGELTAALRAIYLEGARGQAAAAAHHLYELESQVAAADRKHDLTPLDHATARIVRGIERGVRGESGDPGALLVLALFHQGVANLESDLRQPVLAQRNWALALLFLQRMGKISPRADDRRLAAAALAGLALRHLERSSPQPAAMLLEKALAVSGDQPQLLIALAVVRTQQGDARQARALLDRALARTPGNREALLRRALADAAAGARESAERDLRRLSEGSEKDWLTILAYQERARLTLERERYDDASALLVRALARFPDDPTLALALAYARRSQGRRAEAGELAERALAAASSPGAAVAAAPRTRYLEGTRGYLVAQRHAAEQAAALRTATFAYLVDDRSARRRDGARERRTDPIRIEP